MHAVRPLHASVIVINGCSPATGTHHAKARIAEEAGACAVMALERVPADIRSEGGVARMASARLGRHPSMVLKMYAFCASPLSRATPG